MKSALLLPYLPSGYLLAALMIATVTDMKSRRIPNTVTFSTIIVALLFYSLTSGWSGLFFSLKGMVCGIVLLILPYSLGGIGAGDVKLMGAVGAVLGAADTFSAFLVIAVLGGLTSIVLLVVRRDLLTTLRRLWNAVCAVFGGLGTAALRVDRPTLEREGIPYGAVIAGGTVVFVLYRLLVVGEGWPHIPI